MLMADHVNIIIFGGLGCIWCHLSRGKCVQNFVQKMLYLHDIFFLSWDQAIELKCSPNDQQI